jgi:hypothetical protein
MCCSSPNDETRSGPFVSCQGGFARPDNATLAPMAAPRELRTRELYKMTLIVEEAPKCEAVAFVALGCWEARADQGSKNGAHNIADLE